MLPPPYQLIFYAAADAVFLLPRDALRYCLYADIFRCRFTRFRYAAGIFD